MSDKADTNLARKRPSKEPQHSHNHHRSTDEWGGQSDEDSSWPRKRRKKPRHKDSKRKRRRHRQDSSSSGEPQKRKSKRSSRKKHSRSVEYSDDDSSVCDSRSRRKRSKKKSKRDKREERRERKSHYKESTDGPSMKQTEAASEKMARIPVNSDISTSETKKNESLEKQDAAAHRARRMAPMSREQYEEQQSVVREVYDEETGRYRLVRGNGEIIERIVSRGDHERINQNATRGDGSSYARHVYSAASRPMFK